MTQISIQRRRTVWDVVLGILLFIGGLVVLGDVVVATAVSVLFIGWVAVITGVIGVIGSLFKIGKGGGFWSALIGGALVGVLGVLILRFPLASAGAITLIAGMVFLVSGVVRLIAGFERTPARWALLISGVASIILGLIVVFNPLQATLTLLGVLLGIQLLIDGLTMLMFGRVRVETSTQPAASDSAV
ncbi:HdeD family acid-resistance protein [Nakamurella lactea]|uniref:HdeD family acid-resistance protein n=1 Tax=Nakamurella lactea TaxID=459515 RepID=UPI00068468B8|nr:DUF308 domain-containing protein [Nakamurella lactea]